MESSSPNEEMAEITEVPDTTGEMKDEYQDPIISQDNQLLVPKPVVRQGNLPSDPDPSEKVEKRTTKKEIKKSTKQGLMLWVCKENKKEERGKKKKKNIETEEKGSSFPSYTHTTFFPTSEFKCGLTRTTLMNFGSKKDKGIRWEKKGAK